MARIRRNTGSGSRILQRNRAFTLIELLVVVAIIALLISILLPSLSQAREQARIVQCLSIQKQFGMANQMYADDSDQYFVSVWTYGDTDAEHGAWFQNTKFRAMIGMEPGITAPDEYACPNGPEEELELDHFYHTFGMNWSGMIEDWTQRASTRYTIHRPSISSPAQKVQLGDMTAPESSSAWNEADWRIMWDVVGDLSPHRGGAWLYAYRHNEGANMQHFDGHASYYTKTEAGPTSAGDNPWDWETMYRLYEDYDTP